MKVHIKARPNSGKQEVVKVDEKNYEIYLKSVPEANKANIELIKILSKYFNSDVKIVSGRSLRRKIVEIAK